ncbi:hypothetical protein SOV_17190 [Sporomusa ovata DSM 2662]|nr:PcfJ domain-containing protein [Sporomusa ovata]EQB29319.1 hypothetical protein SOV_1c10520 [Sporomusa ovata DSM 2662]
MAERRYSEYLGEILKMLQFTTLRKMFFYMERQLKEKNPNKKHYREEFQVLMTWRDYVTDCNTLNMDLTQESVLFPANLHNAHQNTIRQIKIKEDAGLNKKIAVRLKSLRKYCYSGDTLLIRPAESTLELIDEGKALHHCVGMYGQQYAKGETVILFIRKIAEPDKPYFTVEVHGRNNTVMQVRGKHNAQPGSDVSAFMEAFALERLGKEESIQNRITVPA